MNRWLTPVAFAVCTTIAICEETLTELPIQTRLPQVMQLDNGQPVSTMKQWKQRRKQLTRLLLHYQYGSMPGRPDRVTGTDVQRHEHVSGKGTVEHITLVIESKTQPIPLRMRIAMFIPHRAKTRGPFPAIIREEGHLDGNDFVETLLDHDYVFIEYARHDLDPDKKDTVGDAQRAYPQNDWATLAVWAWGGMRVADYLESRGEVNLDQLAITGHSRGGKMALLAGALDQRFSVVAPVQSGAGGAGSYTMLGPGGESLMMNDKPHWYADRIQMFAGHTHRLPFDQHFLKALVAPRGLLCIESVDDDYANPVGTQFTTVAAQPAFDQFGKSDRIRNALTYRNGSHSFSTADWQTLLAFTEWHFRDRRPQHADRFRARPFNLPHAWSGMANREGFRKGIESERISQVHQSAPGMTGFTSIDAPGNPKANDYFGMGRFGRVDYEFEMGRQQVTNSQYTAFLNAIHVPDERTNFLYDPEMAIVQNSQNGQRRYTPKPETANRGVTHVAWSSAARYCNWLHQAKPTGPPGPTTTESGAYDLTDKRLVASRTRDAKYALPNDDEWFKAAYYDPTTGYQLYEHQTDGGLRVRKHAINAVSPYQISGMYDRLWEWNENSVNGLFRSVRSGAWFVGNNRQAAGRLYASPELRLPNIGFRVVRLPD